MSKKIKHYEEEFKTQIVMLYKIVKNIRKISKEYDVPKSTINVWVKLYEKCGSFKIS